MPNQLLLKNAIYESRLFKDRVIIAWLMTLILTSVLIMRLVYLQILDHEHFTTLSENNRLKIQPLSPTRGLIYDRNGVVLAKNLPSYTLKVIPEKVDDFEQLFTDLAQIIALSEHDISRFKKALKHKKHFNYIPLRFRLTDEEVARLSVRSYRFPSLKIAATLVRYYPKGNIGVHALGYVGRINPKEMQRIDTEAYRGTDYIGKIGIEKYYEDVLHGKVGLQTVETNAQGRILRVVEQQNPTPGQNIYLNLDIVLQEYAENLLAGERAALVAIEPDTGGVLTLASVPTYDPNLFVNGIDHKSYNALNRSEDRPLVNRAIRGQYPPGSTIKAFVGLAGLEYGVRQSASSTFCPGWYRLKGKKHKYRDWKRAGHGRMNFHHAVEQSCDVYFYDLAHDLGITRLSTFMRRFGFGELSHIDTSGELSGLMPSKDWKKRRYGTVWYPGETIITGIGQGFMLATPLQLAVATAALSQRGKTKLPRLVFSKEQAGTHKMQIISAKIPSRIVLRKEHYWDGAIEAMESVLHGARGTARKQAKNLPYRIAGKTGTAQVVKIKQNERYNAAKLDKRYHDHALFVAFAPVHNPKIAVAVIVENGGSGSGTAAPIARKLIDYYLRQRLKMKFETKTPDKIKH
jgi:penicillin-binding protein 2